MKFLILLFLIASIASFAQDIPYNKAQFKASHNSYAKDIPLWDQLTTHQFTAIEFDLHTKKVLKSAPTGDWYVYHHLFDRKSQFRLLSDGLKIISKYHAEFPDHNVLTVFMDMSGFNKKHSTEMFDILLEENLGDAIYSPADLIKNCPNTKNLSNAAETCGWPNLSKLKGKIIFVLTEGELNHYLENSKSPRAFVASKPNQKIDDSIFMNIAYDENIDWLDKLREKNIITRFYFVENKKQFFDSLEKLVNFIAIDHVDSKKHPWQDQKKGEP